MKFLYAVYVLVIVYCKCVMKTKPKSKAPLNIGSFYFDCYYCWIVEIEPEFTACI